MAPFCNLFMERPSYITYLLTYWTTHRGVVGQGHREMLCLNFFAMQIIHPDYFNKIHVKSQLCIIVCKTY